MSEIEINNIYELCSFIDSNSKYDKVSIDLTEISEYGNLKHTLKHLLWKLNLGGTAELKFAGENKFLHDVHSLSFWQLKFSLINTLANDVRILGMEDDRVLIEKCKENYCINGVSFGIVFSGNKNEEEQLLNSLFSIQSAIFHSDLLNVEIVVCGPSNYDFNLIKDNLSIDVKYLTFDDVYDMESNRFLISKKKNFLINELSYDACVISHTRISFNNDFISKLNNKKFDIASPLILDSNTNKPYLGFVLTGSYDASKLNSKKTITGQMLTSHYFKLMKKRVAYSDGGVIIFNKNNIKHIFNENLAWGEGEDVDFCAQNYFAGCITDYLKDVICYSTKNKVNQSKLKNNRVINKIRCKLIEFGFF